jgi:hypothetical protein
MRLIPKPAGKPEDGRIARFERPADMAVKPFLKWAGGKSQILKDIMVHTFEIRGGGKAALLLTKPAASGDACASPQGRRNKMRLPCPQGDFRLTPGYAGHTVPVTPSFGG